MYGEGDPYYVVAALKSAISRNNTLPPIGDGSAMYQQTYVGNSAWAFVCAEKAMFEDKLLGGEFFYIPDNTPVKTTFGFIKPILECRGCQLSERSLPWWLVYYPLKVTETLLRITSPIVKPSLPVASCSIWYITARLYFNGDKARQVLKYSPIYSAEESLKRSISYYKDVDLS